MMRQGRIGGRGEKENVCDGTREKEKEKKDSSLNYKYLAVSLPAGSARYQTVYHWIRLVQ